MITTSNYNKQNPLRVFDAFAGYGSQSLAFKYLKEKHPDFDFKVVGISEIEPSAIQAYRLLHGWEAPNFGDVTRIDWSKEKDGSPIICKSKLYAIAGKSIVTNCLIAMFEELIFPSGKHYHDKSGQLSLF